MGISIGILGLGQFGSGFTAFFKAHPGVDRIAVCDREPERAARYLKREWFEDKLDEKDCFSSYEELLSSNVDAVAIFTQPWLHARQAIEALRRGKHVYSAVPVITLPDPDETIDLLNSLVETCSKTGMRYMLGETTYYRPQTMFCRRKAAEGAFGNFIYAEGEYFHDVDNPGCSLREVYKSRYGSSAGQEWNTEKRKYIEEGILSGPMHYPTHSVSGPVSVMNTHAVSVSAYGYRNANNDPFFEDAAFSNEIALFNMENGVPVRICEFREVAGGIEEEETFRILGTSGSYAGYTWKENHRTDPFTALPLSTQNVSPEDMRDPLPPDVFEALSAAWQEEKGSGADLFQSGHGGSHPYLVHEFVSSICSDRMPAVNAWEAARYNVMGAVAHKSALNDGERLAVPDWGDAPD